MLIVSFLEEMFSMVKERTAGVLTIREPKSKKFCEEGVQIWYRRE